jgi:hypothetical protein
MNAHMVHGFGQSNREDARDPGTKDDAVEGSPRGDLGRRIARRRTELGLTRRETAQRAGMAPSYLRYL